MVRRFQNEGEIMNCIHCRGHMARGTTPLHLDRKAFHLIFDAVPAWVCEQCGEAYFEEREVEAIQDLVQSMESKAEALIATS